MSRVSAEGSGPDDDHLYIFSDLGFSLQLQEMQPLSQ